MAASAIRAMLFLASAPLGLDTLTFAEVSAPDGTSVFFADDADAWIGDFVALDAGNAATGRLRVDHVGLPQPVDAFDEAVLFYRSVLGLSPARAGTSPHRPGSSAAEL